jgi:hypothetical protein
VRERDALGVGAVRWREEREGGDKTKKGEVRDGEKVEDKKVIMNGGVEETPTKKKKRGRPTNVELARRAEAKAALERGQ